MEGPKSDCPKFDCPDCGEWIKGTNCAHTLSRAEGWKNIKGCEFMCKCKYPVRAKEVKDRIYGKQID